MNLNIFKPDVLTLKIVDVEPYMKIVRCQTLDVDSRVNTYDIPLQTSSYSMIPYVKNSGNTNFKIEVDYINKNQFNAAEVSDLDSKIGSSLSRIPLRARIEFNDVSATEFVDNSNRVAIAGQSPNVHFSVTSPEPIQNTMSYQSSSDNSMTHMKSKSNVDGEG